MRKIFVLSFVFFVLITLIGSSAEAPNSFTVKGGNVEQIIQIGCPSGSNDLVKDFTEVFAERLSAFTGNKVFAIGSDEDSSQLPDFTVYISTDSV